MGGVRCGGAVVGLLRKSSKDSKGIIKEARASSQGLVRASQQSAQRTSLDYCKNLQGILEHIHQSCGCNSKEIHRASMGNPFGIYWEAITNPVRNQGGTMVIPKVVKKELKDNPFGIHRHFVTDACEINK